MTTNHHNVIATGAAANASVFNSPLAQLDAAITTNATAAAATTAEVVAARAAYPNLDARLTDLILSGGNVATKANGVSDAGQKVLTVDATDGFVVGAYVTYLLNGTDLEGNTIASIQAGVSLTLGTNIGTGGVLDDTYISMISTSEYLAAQAIPHAGTLLLPQTMEYANGGVFNVAAYGAKGDGVTNDAPAIQAAIDAAAPRGVVDLATGKFYLESTLTIDVGSSITIKGGGDIAAAPGYYPATSLIKASTLNGAAIDVKGFGSKLTGFLLDGESGNGGDGIWVRANGVNLEDISVFRQGSCGVRIGVTADATNSNSFLLSRVRVRNNVSHGIYVHSNASGDPEELNANAGTMILVEASENGGDGIRLDKCAKNTILGVHVEANTGYGLHLTANSLQNCILGGDTAENNVAGNINNAGTANVIIGVQDGTYTDSSLGTVRITRFATTVPFIRVIGEALVNQLTVTDTDASSQVTLLGRQVFLNGTPAVTNGSEVTLFTCALPANVASLYGTLYLNYQHAVGGNGTFRCARAYSIVAITDNVGAEVLSSTVIPEYSYDNKLTSNAMALSWSTGVLSVKNTNTQELTPGMKLSWSFVGHYYEASDFVVT